MKTFIFCTSYFNDNLTYQRRYVKWVDYYLGHSFTKDKDIFVIDDGSDMDYVEDPPFHNVLYEDQLGNYKPLVGKVNMIHFHKRLGGFSHSGGTAANSMGWWRSFAFALKIAQDLEYDKVIHLESDAYLISNNVFKHFDEIETGWHSLWSEKYTMPESSAQIICKDKFSVFEEVISKNHEQLSHGLAERIIPFSNVIKKFRGDRYGEAHRDQGIPQPEGADYYCQCNYDLDIIPEEKK